MAWDAEGPPEAIVVNGIEGIDAEGQARLIVAQDFSGYEALPFGQKRDSDLVLVEALDQLARPSPANARAPAGLESKT